MAQVGGSHAVAEAPPPPVGSVWSRTWAERSTALSCVIVVLLATFWAMSPRFALTRPSLTDDWLGILYSPTAVHDLVRGHYDAAVVDFNGRFRPTYLVWQYLVWHAGPGGKSLLFPTVWLFLAASVFLASVGWLAGLAASRFVTTRWSVVLGACAALCVVLTPQTGTDLASFSANEPIAVGVLAVGLLCAFESMKRLARPDSARRWLHLLLLVLGFALYLFGVYMWEAAVALVLLLPSFYRWSSMQFARRSGRVQRALPAIGVLLLAAPLAHQAVNLLRAERAMSSHSGSEAGLGGTAHTVGIAFERMFAGMFLSLGTPLWPVLLAAVVWGWLRLRRRRDETSVFWGALLGSALLATAIANAASVHVTHAPGRYFVPLLAVTAILGARCLAAMRPKARVWTLVGVVGLFLLVGLPRSSLRNYVVDQENGEAAIDFTAGLSAGHCQIYLSNLPHRLGLPRLLDYGSAAVRPACAGSRTTAYTVNWGLVDQPPRFPERCASGWRVVAHAQAVDVFRCARFHAVAGVPDQEVDPVDPAIRLVRFAPVHGRPPASSLVTIGAYTVGREKR